MALLRKQGNDLKVISPTFYRTWVGTSSAYEQQKSQIPNGTLIYITDDTAPTSAILESVYPVGSIYISTVSTSPATLFGFGTWEQLPNDVYLKSMGSSGLPLDVSGSNTHTITEAELPAHQHTHTPVGTINSTFNGIASAHTHTVRQNTASSSYDVVYSRGYGSTYNRGGVALPNDNGSSGNYTTDAAGNQIIGNASITPSGTVTSTFTGSATTTTATGGGQAFDNKPLSVQVYMWRRTA